MIVQIEGNEENISKQLNDSNEAKYETIKEEGLHFSDDFPIIEQIFEKKGYDADTLKCILLTFSVLSIEGLHMSLFSYMIIPLKNFYNLSDAYLSLVSSIIFIGVGLGSFISGHASFKYGRTLLINLFLWIIFVLTFLSSFSNSYFLFAIYRFVIGFGLGLVVPLSINLLAENLPIRFRALVLTSIWIGFGVGSVYLLSIMYFVMPNYEFNQVKKTLFISSLLPLITFLLSYFYLKDSPRSLILRNKHVEAVEILENCIKRKFDRQTKMRIINEVKIGNTNQTHDSSVTELFRGRFTLLTISLSVIWCIDSVVSYGTCLISSLTLKVLGVVEKFDNKEIIIKQMYMTVFSSFGNVLGGLLSEVPFLGRNKTTLITFALSSFFLLLIPLMSNFYTLLFSLCQFFWSIAMNVNTVYSCEVYPTQVRDKAIGFLFFMTRVGGFVSQFLFISLNDMGMWVPYYVAAILFFINSAFTYLMPYETLGKPLDAPPCNSEAQNRNEKS